MLDAGREGTPRMLLTTIAGSLPKPAWLAAPELLWAPWRLPPDQLPDGQRDAVLIALKEQEAAGIDIVTDGEQFRQHFVHGFLERLDGIDFTREHKAPAYNDLLFCVWTDKTVHHRQHGQRNQDCRHRQGESRT
jgi:methionine synthase II (cobalamin-independent)